ncbi:copper resistance D family protein [Nocardia sp. NPDC059177]|uniref:copper resistance D family protein n=1 Tax=Nocardia sp. NPDC059177 TaxID=3346759 RepID=UPI00368DAF9D
MTSSRRAFGLAVLITTALAALLAGISAGHIADPPPPALLAFDPGPFTRWGGPLLRLVGTTTAVLTVGSLLGMVLLGGPTEHRRTTDSLRRGARRLALTTAATLAFQAMLGISAIVGKPVLDIPPADVVACLTSPSIAYCLAGSAGFLTLAVLTRTTVLPLTLLTVAMVAVCLPFLGGHPSSASNHVINVAMIVAHVVCAALWVGGVAVLVFIGAVRGDRAALRVALPKLSRLALVCAAVTAASGLGSLLARIPEADGFSRTYLLLVLAKAAGLAGLVAFGAWHRRHSVPTVARGGSPERFLYTGFAEAVVMTAVVATATVLSQTPPGGPG